MLYDCNQRGVRWLLEHISRTLLQRTVYPIRRPNVHELRQTAVIAPHFVTLAGDIKKSTVHTEQLRNLELNRVPRGIRKVYRLNFAAVGESPTKTREREWRNNVRTFEQFRVVADLPELHHQVHERTSGVRITEVRRLGKQVGDRDVGSKDFVQLPLSSTKIYVDVDLNLESGELLEAYDGDRLPPSRSIRFGRVS